MENDINWTKLKKLSELDSEAKEIAWIEYKRQNKSKISLEEFLADERLTETLRFDDTGIIAFQFPF